MVNNLISFKDGNGSLGAVEGNGSGGVTNASTGGDYAECLKRIDPEEKIEPGEIVGVYSGKITRNTKNADLVLPVSKWSIVLGNAPFDGTRHLYEPVAFLGQVPVKIRGKVSKGDYIFPSGNNDGAGVAVSPEKLSSIKEPVVIGRAWESSGEEKIKEILTAINLPDNVRVNILQNKLNQMENENQELRDRLEKIEEVLKIKKLSMK